jgi:hypothetical protein
MGNVSVVQIRIYGDSIGILLGDRAGYWKTETRIKKGRWKGATSDKGRRG